METKPKILVIDIEWAPALAYVWRMWDENISPDQLVDHGGLLCFCAHWHGTKDYQFYSEWDDGRTGMAEAAKALLSEADAVVTYNGDKYDLPKLLGEILLAGLSPPPPPTSIDLIKTVKKFGYNMNRLAYIAKLMGLGEKMKHEGFNLWKETLEGSRSAQRTMRKYCIQDVKITDKLYSKIKPFIRNHPHLGFTKPNACGACGSTHVQSRGVRRTKSFIIQRLQCQSCGSWHEGTRKKVSG